MKKETVKKFTIIAVIVLFFGAFLGTLVHEVVGHGLTATLLGGEITKICVLFLEVNSEGLSFTPCVSKEGSFFGWAGLQFEKPTPMNYGFSTIMGPLLTFLVSIVFSFIILFKEKLVGYSKYVLTIFSLYFMDIIYNFFKFYLGIGDFSDILINLDISLVPLLPVVLFGIFTTTTILFYKLKNKKIKTNLKLMLSLLLSLTLISLIIFLTHFGFEIYRIWY